MLLLVSIVSNEKRSSFPFTKAGRLQATRHAYLLNIVLNLLASLHTFCTWRGVRHILSQKACGDT